MNDMQEQFLCVEKAFEIMKSTEEMLLQIMGKTPSELFCAAIFSGWENVHNFTLASETQTHISGGRKKHVLFIFHNCFNPPSKNRNTQNSQKYYL